MNNKFRYLTCVLIIAIANIAQAKIIPTYSVQATTMQEMSAWVDKDTIVFIDIDDVLMIPKSLMFSKNSNPYGSFVKNMVARGKKINHYNVSVAKWYQQRQVKLVEKEWPDYIKELQAKGALVYGVCKMPLQLVNIEEKRYFEATELGLLFNNKINNQGIFKIKKENEWFSSFNKGIIFTGPYSRSNTIFDFLKLIKKLPKKALFISSIEDDLKRLNKKLRVFDMDYFNVQYLGARNLPGSPDPEIVKFQQKVLLNNGIWMEDDVAKDALDKHKAEQSTGAIK
ncbi:MAG: DUF2608 domain-containing protein [Rickettsiaceae bacterium]|nr:DUF2608 domain-containing protein [Rickettsiaceae bacterium]